MSKLKDAGKALARGFVRGFTEEEKTPVPRRARTRKEADDLATPDVEEPTPTVVSDPLASRYIGKGRCPECFELDRPLFRTDGLETVCRGCILGES